MSLSSALDTAKSSIVASQTQTALVSRNIANLNTVGATRKYANVVTGPEGRVEIRSTSQSSNSVLYRNMLDAQSSVGRWTVIGNGLDRINETIGDTTLNRSPAAAIGKLDDALRSLASSPNNYELARSAVDAAADLVTTLNDATLTVQTIRQDADNELVAAASDMNAILADIEKLNELIVTGTRAGTDITDLSDKRDQAVSKLSGYVGVTSRTRGPNDLVLYTDSGVTLFETKARLVEFTATPGISGGVASGSAFKIDGTAVTGDNAYMPIKSGKVVGLVQLRDEVMVTYQTQLDEVARGLVAAFAESDTSATPSRPDQAGLFTSTVIPEEPKLAATFSAGTIAAGDRLVFDIEYGNTTYKASHVFTAAPSAATYRAALQTAIDQAVPAGGGASLGAGKITVGGAGSAVSITALGAAAYSPFAISSIAASPNDATRTGGIATGGTMTAGVAGPPATATTLSAGNFAAGSIAAGDTLSFDLVVDGATYRATHVFASAPANAASYQAILQTAINGATRVPGGAALGSGKVSAAASGTTPFAITLSSVATGAGHTLSVSSVSGIAAGSADPAKTGGLTAASVVSATAGLAGTLRLAAGVALDPVKIRDGGINGASYDDNPTDAGGFSGRLNELGQALAASRGFSADADADTAASLGDFAASSISWLQDARSTALAEADYRSTLLERTQETLSNETGINMEEQMSLLIQIERSYQASAKLLSTIDEMLATLIQSV